MPTQKDPSTFGYQNFFSTTLTGDITASTLTIGLATVPTPTSGILVIEPDSTSSREVIFYTSKGASTVTCPTDGRGWSGSTATSHLQGSTVIMAAVDEYFEGLADGTLSTDPLRPVLAPNFVYSGGSVAQSAGLVGTFSNIVFYLNGQQYSGSSIANKTYTASKDTYVDITAASGGAVSVTYTEVANGAASPALAANYVRIAKVVTNGSAITSVTQSGLDSLGNPIKPKKPITFPVDTNYIQLGNIMIAWGTTTTSNIGTAAGTEVSGTITFPTAFAAAPIALCNPSDLGNACAEYAFVTSTSTTGATYWAGHAIASSGVIPMTLRWMAIGPC